jgi:hypothetical protein
VQLLLGARRRDFDTQRFGSLEVDDELKPGRLLYRY